MTSQITAPERSDRLVDTGLQFTPGDPVRVRVAHRDHRISVSDEGAAIGRAGRPVGWRGAGRRLADELAVNISRDGVISLPVVRVGPPEEQIVRRIAEASRAFFQELLELSE